MVEGGGTMALRHNDPQYLARVDLWWDELLPKLTRFLHVNGGRVLMVQVRPGLQPIQPRPSVQAGCQQSFALHAGPWCRL